MKILYEFDYNHITGAQGTRGCKWARGAEGSMGSKRHKGQRGLQMATERGVKGGTRGMEVQGAQGCRVP